MGASKQYFSQSIGEYPLTLILRMERGMPDSELVPPLVLILYLGESAASQTETVELLPAEPVMPTMVILRFLRS